MHDLVISDARVCDGTGAPIEHASVAVRNGRISAIGSDLGPAVTTVDAQGHVLAPGIVDVHTHYDAQLTWDPTATPSPALGVTTVVVGNCGFGIAPCRPEDREMTARHLTKVEGMSFDSLVAGIVWDFETFGEYLDSLTRRGVVPNVASFVGHSPIRTYVMGAEANQRAATTAEIEAMRAILREALRAGAIGLGTSTLETHNGHGGVPVASRFAAADEFAALGAVLGEESVGVLQITKGVSTGADQLEEIARSSGRAVHVCPMLFDPGSPDVVFDEMAAIAAARDRGAQVYGQVSPFPEIMDFQLTQPFPMESVAAWRPAMAAADHEELKAVYRDESFRRAVDAELATRGAPFRFSNQWVAMTIVSSPNQPELQGRTVLDVALERDVSPLDCMLDIGLADDLETQFSVAMFNGDEANVTKLLEHPGAVIGLGDAGAHLSFFCQAGTGLFLFQRYVRELQALRIEEAVRMLTSVPADAFRISERGRIQVGYHADMMLFDPETAGLGPNEIVRDLPADASRIDRRPIGVHGVWVNGVQVANSTGLLADTPRVGQVLRRFAA